MAIIEFFYDLTSPYSYLASTQIEGVAKRAGAVLQPKPFVLGAIFKVHETKLQVSNPVRARYLFRDVAMWAREYGVPAVWPDQFPVNAIKPMRAIIAVEDPAQSWKLTEGLYRAYWGHGRDISQPDVIATVIGEAGLQPDQVLAATERQDVKDRLRANTDNALERGVFGAPTMFVGDQMFFGNDRLAFVERAARGERVQE